MTKKRRLKIALRVKQLILNGKSHKEINRILKIYDPVGSQLLWKRRGKGIMPKRGEV